MEDAIKKADEAGFKFEADVGRRKISLLREPPPKLASESDIDDMATDKEEKRQAIRDAIRSAKTENDLSPAIKAADALGLSFEARIGRRKMSRLKGLVSSDVGYSEPWFYRSELQPRDDYPSDPGYSYITLNTPKACGVFRTKASFESYMDPEHPIFLKRPVLPTALRFLELAVR